MGITVHFYQMGKAVNSTALPNAQTPNIVFFNTVQLKAPCTVTSPTISLTNPDATWNPSAYNYAYIPAFNRRYWVTEWQNAGPVWTASLQVDVLGSWRSAIGASSAYILRSSAAFDRNVVDTVYPTTSDRHDEMLLLPKLWNPDGANVNGDTAPWYFVTVIGGASGGATGTAVIAVTQQGLVDLLDAVFSNDYYTAVLGTFGATEYPEAKVAINPMQYISSIKKVYASVRNVSGWSFPSVGTVTGVYVGPVLVSPTNWSALLVAGTRVNYVDYVPSALQHPQANDRGEWLNTDPYTNYEIYVPPFGIIPLDAAEIFQHDRLRVQVSFDARTTCARLEVIVYNTSDTTRLHVLAQAIAEIGIDIPIANIIQPGTSAMQFLPAILGGAAGLGALAAGNPSGAAGVVNSAASGIGTAIHGQIPHLSTLGHYGTGCALAGQPGIYVTHWLMADDDNANQGRPLMENRRIDTLSGYLVIDPHSLAIPCTQPELEQIYNLTSQGFYYV